MVAYRECLYLVNIIVKEYCFDYVCTWLKCSVFVVNVWYIEIAYLLNNLLWLQFFTY